MGKTTLYHPVALTVLRGALNYNGFIVGKFNQLRYDEERGTAVYMVPLIAWNSGTASYDKRLDQFSVHDLLDALRGCFASDVDVTAVWVTPSGSYQARIETRTEQRNFLAGIEK